MSYNPRRQRLQVPVSEKLSALEGRVFDLREKIKLVDQEIEYERLGVQKHIEWGSGDEWIVELRIHELINSIAVDRQTLSVLEAQIESVRLMEWKAIGKALTYQRQLQNYTVEDVARAIGAEERSVRALESGEWIVLNDDLAGAVAFLRVSVDAAVKQRST